MKIETYLDIDEKVKYFDLRPIETKDELETFFKQYSRTKSYYFRGVSQSDYKLYTSGQRFWKLLDYNDINVDYLDFFNNYCIEVLSQNKGLLSKYFMNFKDANISFSTLSYIQHFGGPTPLLDFTTSFNKGLFFSLSNAKAIHSDEILQNYVSLYLLDKKKVFVDYQKQINSVEKEVLGHLKTIYAKGYMDNVAFSKSKKELIALRQKDLFKGLSKNLIYLIKNNGSQNGNNLFPNNNLNIISQDGFFILNPSDSKPLEEMVLYPFIDDLTKNGISRKDFIDFASTKVEKIICYEIHKRLLPFVEEYLTKKGITDSTIYPNSERIINDALRKVQVNTTANSKLPGKSGGSASLTGN